MFRVLLKAIAPVALEVAGTLVTTILVELRKKIN